MKLSETWQLVDSGTLVRPSPIGRLAWLPLGSLCPCTFPYSYKVVIEKEPGQYSRQSGKRAGSTQRLRPSQCRAGGARPRRS